MPRVLQVPADLDAAGAQFWTILVELRQCEGAARVVYRSARTALRRRLITPASPNLAAMTTQYHHSEATLNEITDRRT